ncbi:phenylalanine--tRNA ligase subunit alpha [Candidatus Saccharibacteria bacterium]|nr:phenylalanine--tRNA ligase subunit alpha [Candidatus Saccharibacteria bacterium]MCB9835014.1 phenylalanine--tRNA ligase subunit alpha [Candidatus Nomurabacteria bacterium]
MANWNQSIRLENLEQILDQFEYQLKKQTSLEGLAELRREYLGKKSEINQALRGLGNASLEERKSYGQKINQIKDQMIRLAADREKELASQTTDWGRLDLSAPLGKSNQPKARLHPISNILLEITELAGKLGYRVTDGPEVETDWYNFTALNMDEDHPARDGWDTFYLDQYHEGKQMLARTHTSPVQIRYLENNQLPIKVLVPGKVYRNEDEDSTHLWNFYQLEGLVVDRGVSMADLRGAIQSILMELLDDQIETRLRPSFFPFTEPSVEIDVKYQGQWLELAGGGMVHPKILENQGIDPDIYQGFAFGFGLDRIAAVKYGVEDVRYFWRPDYRFLTQRFVR